MDPTLPDGIPKRDPRSEECQCFTWAKATKVNGKGKTKSCQEWAGLLARVKRAQAHCERMKNGWIRHRASKHIPKPPLNPTLNPKALNPEDPNPNSVNALQPEYGGLNKTNSLPSGSSTKLYYIYIYYLYLYRLSIVYYLYLYLHLYLYLYISLYIYIYIYSFTE